MARQVGAVLGVAVLVGILGSPATPAEALDAFRLGWLAVVIACVLAAAAALTIRTKPTAAPSLATGTDDGRRP
jgi:hypothetical protein